MAHLGPRAFDAIGGEVVNVTADVIYNGRAACEGAYVRLVDINGSEAKRLKLLEAIENLDCGWFYRRDAETFKQIPGTPIAYWASDGLINAFSIREGLRSYARPTAGIRTGDNDRFLRFAWEVSFEKVGIHLRDRAQAKESGCKWFPANKGGLYRKWFGNLDYVINWENDGEELSSFPGCDNAGVKFFFRAGVTWGTISSGSLSVRYCDPGVISEHCGSMCFSESNDVLLCVVGLLNSSVSDAFHQFLSPTLAFREAAIGNTPLDERGVCPEVSSIVNQCIEESKIDWDSFETSWDFKHHPLV
ncbi:hypothetical protein AAAX59_09085 [Collinsella sp. CLA-ER-H2]|uniref:hypothetical protein n=1 Tax=Collinsella sp. CLA-ER-H2 TaxID=3136220 RepID=UPI0032C0002E